MAKDWRQRRYQQPLPPFVKTAAILEYQRRFDLELFVETGTYLGDTLAFCGPHFQRSHSIELDPNLHRAAQKRFAGVSGTELHLGDSASELPKLLQRIDRPTLFWLDAHYSAGVTGRAEIDTPILAEIETVLKASAGEHVILIDDAHCFGSWPDYPTLEALERYVADLDPDQTVYLASNMVRIHRSDRLR